MFIIGLALLFIGGEHLRFTVSTRHVGELVCRKCGATITRQSELMNVTTPNSLMKYKYEFPIVGKNTTVHVFENPAGEVFHVAASKTAVLKFHGGASTDHSWFPGMQWTICVCSHCGQHIGWYFEPVDDNGVKLEEDYASKKNDFIGIVLDYVISADYVDQITRVPL